MLHSVPTDRIIKIILGRKKKIPGENVAAEETITSAFTVHLLHELSNTFLLQDAVLEVAKQHGWL
jgi:hypothetical protein